MSLDDPRVTTATDTGSTACQTTLFYHEMFRFIQLQQDTFRMKILLQISTDLGYQNVIKNKRTHLKIKQVFVYISLAILVLRGTLLGKC